jgi:hypothetical protein
VQASTDIPRGNIHLASTHTHGGPDLQGLWNGSSENYQQYFASGCVEAITVAYANRRLARLFVSNANVSDWQSNRRGHGWYPCRLICCIPPGCVCVGVLT